MSKTHNTFAGKLLNGIYNGLNPAEISVRPQQMLQPIVQPQQQIQQVQQQPPVQPQQTPV